MVPKQGRPYCKHNQAQRETGNEQRRQTGQRRGGQRGIAFPGNGRIAAMRGGLSRRGTFGRRARELCARAGPRSRQWSHPENPDRTGAIAPAFAGVDRTGVSYNDFGLSHYADPGPAIDWLRSAVHAEPTIVEARAIARGARFIGGFQAPVRITLVDADTGEVRASGQTKGTTRHAAHPRPGRCKKRALAGADRRTAR